MFASPEESPPFVTFVSAVTQTQVAKYIFPTDTSGLEQCVYDHTTGKFLINNDGTNTNPAGEIDVISAASVLATNPVVSAAYPLPGCFPGGLALGPNTDILVGCNAPPPTGAPQITLILNRASGANMATIPFGGEDAVAYDPVTNKYFLAAFFHQNSGYAGDPAAASPSLGVIGASSKSLIAALPIGNGAHGVAVDSATHQVFVPHLGGPPGSPFAIPGITVFSTN